MKPTIEQLLRAAVGPVMMERGRPYRLGELTTIVGGGLGRRVVLYAPPRDVRDPVPAVILAWSAADDGRPPFEAIRLVATLLEHGIANLDALLAPAPAGPGEKLVVSPAPAAETKTP
jgi:hypothetical protein